MPVLVDVGWLPERIDVDRVQRLVEQVADAAQITGREAVRRGQSVDVQEDIRSDVREPSDHGLEDGCRVRVGGGDDTERANGPDVRRNLCTAARSPEAQGAVQPHGRLTSDQLAVGRAQARVEHPLTRAGPGIGRACRYGGWYDR